MIRSLGIEAHSAKKRLSAPTKIESVRSEKAVVWSVISGNTTNWIQYKGIMVGFSLLGANRGWVTPLFPMEPNSTFRREHLNNADNNIDNDIYINIDIVSNIKYLKKPLLEWKLQRFRTASKCVGMKMISSEVQEQIIEALRSASAEGKLGLTTRQIAQLLGTYRGRIMANASVLKERNVLNCQKIGAAFVWYLTEKAEGNS